MNLAITLLVWLVVGGIVFYVLWWALGKLQLEEPFSKIATAVLVLATVVFALYIASGILPALPHGR